MEREYDAVPKGDSLMRLAEDLFLFFKSAARGAFPRGLAKPLIGLSWVKRCFSLAPIIEHKVVKQATNTSYLV